MYFNGSFKRAEHPMSSVKTYGKMLAYVRPYLHLFILSALLSLLIVSLDGLSIWFLSSLPQTLFNPTAMHLDKPVLTFQTVNLWLKYWTYKAVVGKDQQRTLFFVCALILFTYTFKNVFSYVGRLLAQLLNQSIVRDLRNTCFRHILLLPVGYHDRNRSGNLVSLVVNDITQINYSLTNTLSSLVMEPLRLISFIGILFVINYKLTILVFAIYPLLVYLIGQIGKSVRRRARRELESFSGMLSVLTETIAGVRAVKMFNMNEVENAKFRNENETYAQRALKSVATQAILSPMTETLGVLVTVTLIWYGGREALFGHSAFTAEDFFRFIFFLFSSYTPIKNLASANNSIQSGIAGAQRVFAMLDSPPEPIQSSVSAPKPVFRESVSFEHVDFTYPGTETRVLHDVSFTARKGQVIAIVGSSGSGKSTILDLLPRFYDVESGSIKIDGLETRQMNLAGLRDLFGIVSQETILFNDSVKNNIAYGSAGASPAAIRQAAESANALEFIEAMPEGMNTPIGERGVTLSGGQRQRLSIARALLRNPQILILDEATSALDTESERLVQAAINNLISNRTTFVVAHRLSTIQHADHILVIEAGRIVEAGSHQELFDRNGRYRYFHDMQFAGPPTRGS
jgi:ATP-binding cassette, subfamily B, bacterial MsbA